MKSKMMKVADKDMMDILTPALSTTVLLFPNQLIFFSVGDKTAS